MVMRFGELERAFAALDEMHRRMDRMFGDIGMGMAQAAPALRAWPPANLYDEGENLVLIAEVPGVDESDLEITATGEILTIGGKRVAEDMKGYSVHRQERSHRDFSRSFHLPVRVKPGDIQARLKNGLLMVTMPKAEEARPRRIQVKG